MADQCEQLRTHHYDGVLGNEMVFTKEFLASNGMSYDAKLAIVNTFISDILGFNLPEKDNACNDYLRTIVAQWGTSQNYDATNDVHAEDMLYILALEFNNMRLLFCSDEHFVNNTSLQDFCRELFIQLSDVQTGACPQGRTTRLWQIVYGYFEYFNCTVL